MLEGTAVLVQLGKQDLVHGADGARTSRAVTEVVGEKRIARASARTGDGIVTAVKLAAALALAKERDSIEARKKGAPPPKVAPAPHASWPKRPRTASCSAATGRSTTPPCRSPSS